MTTILLLNEKLRPDPFPLQIFPFDTEESIKNRIALTNSTLPQYIHHTDIETTSPVVVHDLWRLVRRFTEKSLNAVEFIREYEKFFTKRDILLVWLGMKNIRLEFANRMIPDNPITQSEIPNLIKDFEKFKKSQSRREEYIQLIFRNQVELSDFDVNKINYIQHFEFDGDLYRIFDLIPMNDEIYCITFADFYRLKKGFTPILNWSSSHEYITIKHTHEYHNISIERVETGKFRIMTTEQIDFRGMLPFVDSWGELEETNVNGDFIVSQNINLKVLEDVLFTPNMFNVFSLNDNNKIQSDVFASRDVVFQHPFRQDVSVSFSISNIGLNSKIHIRHIESQYIDEFKMFVANLIFLYNSSYDSVILNYKKNGINLEKKVKAKPKNLLKSKLNNKNLFSKQWVRKCQFPRKIFRVKEYDEVGRQVDEIEENGIKYSTILFPKETFTFSDGTVEEPHYYYCHHTDKQPYYVGLKPSNTEIGFEVCCYKTNQKDKTTSSYFAYYKPELYEEPQTQTSYIIEKRKKLNNDQKGLLTPFPILEKTFETLGQPFRWGVDKTPSSFLECLSKALNISINRNSLLSNIRNLEFLGQEMYDMNPEQIREFFTNDTIYLNPLRCVRLLEKIYQVNIFLFDQRGMMLPHHNKFYVPYVKQYDKSICILINEGAEFDSKEYPHCELLVLGLDIKTQGQKIVNFTPQFVITQNQEYLITLYDYFSQLHIGSMNYFPKDIPVENATSQYLDEFGKTRALKINYRGKQLIIQTQPLPPFDLPRMDEYMIEQDEELVKLYMMEWGNPATLKHHLSSHITYYSCKHRILDIDISIFVKIPKSNILQSFIENEKASRLKSSLMFMLFAKYVKNGGVMDVGVFVRDTLRIGNSGDIQYKPSQTSIICKSQDEIDSLAYQLQWLVTRNRDKLDILSDQTFIDNYYTKLFDFGSKEVFYKSTNVALPTLFDISDQYLYTTAIPADNLFFFEHYKGTNRQTVFSISTTSVQEAVNMYAMWHSKGYVEIENTPDVMYSSLILFDVPGGKWYSTGELNKNTPIVIKYSHNSFIPVLLL